MTGHLPKTQDKSAGNSGEGETEQQCINNFVAAVTLDEVSFREWKSTHSSLDLTVPLFLTAAEAMDGLRREIKWTRTIHEPGTKQSARCLCKKTFEVPPNTKHKSHFIFPCEGDQKAPHTGNLIVTIFIK